MDNQQSVLSQKQFNEQSKIGENSEDEHNFNFYHQYCRLFIANIMKELINEKTDLIQKLTKLEKKAEEISDPQDDEERKKRFRRTASQIERHYICPDQSCQKSYGSEGSLNQHIKIKHPEIYVDKSIKSGNNQMNYKGDSNSMSDLEQNLSQND